ncbi:MAG: hypothetical protein LC795_01380 [Acidobacteria bacterium]|nr:hypothetical protein [Acidobacteriota bacterium]
MSFYGAPIRSPETKEEVKQAATLLTVLGVIFALVALLGVGLTLASDDPENLILTVVCGFVSLLLFAAGAYNSYYTRKMAHAPFVAAALRHPAITVCVILVAITALVLGGVSLLIFWQ